MTDSDDRRTKADESAFDFDVGSDDTDGGANHETSGGRAQFDYQAIIDRADEWITERPRAVIIAFLVVTALFAVGLGNISTEAGTQQFTEDSPSQQALEEVNEQFSPTF